MSRKGIVWTEDTASITVNMSATDGSHLDHGRHTAAADTDRLLVRQEHSARRGGPRRTGGFRPPGAEAGAVERYGSWQMIRSTALAHC